MRERKDSMPERLRKKKRNMRDKEKDTIIAQWGLPLVILFAVIIILISNFSVTSKNAAKETIDRKLITDCEAYTNTLSNTLSCMTYAGQATAAIIGNDDNRDTDTWAQYAKLLQESIPTPYLVAIVNLRGKGVNNVGTSVDLSEQVYYMQTGVQKYIFVENDGISDHKAFVSIIPIFKDKTVIGMIYMYASAQTILDQVPLKEYDGFTAYGVIDGTGKLMVTSGSSSYYTQGDNFIDNLRTATIQNMKFSKVAMRLGKLVRFTFMTQKNDESKTIISVPVGINDWELITVLNQDYTNYIQSNEWSGARGMARSMAIAIIMFFGLIIIIGVINKLRFNQQSHDLANKADTDLLTDLNNKIATERKIQEFIDENPDTQCLMFLFDIDNFKKINDTMGHAFGDEVLRSLGLQLRKEFRITDIIGRTGGDEFILFLKYIKSNEQLEREGIRMSNFFHQFKAGEYVKYSATASVGAAVFPRDARDFQGLYKAADIALYEAKRRGKNQLMFYHSELDDGTELKRKEVPIDSDNE